MQPLGDNTINVPAFLGKLWKMVNDPETDHLISWNGAGNSFVIQNQAQFWYELLPVYYKHNNMSSFVRQLNMYGFHKVSSVENGTMDADKDEIIFFHPYFQRDKIDLLRNIKRKVTGPKPVVDHAAQSPTKEDEITKVLVDVKQIRGRQLAVDTQLSAMKQENAVLWRELALLRQKHMKQQQIVNKLIHFLLTLVQPRMGVGVKRRYPLMLCEKPAKKKRTSPKTADQKKKEGPTIHELDSEIVATPEDLYEEEVQDCPLINSPETPASSKDGAASTASLANSSSSVLDEESVTPDMLWDKPDLVRPGDYIIGDDGQIIDTLHQIEEEEEQLAAATETDGPAAPSMQSVFLNPSAQDTLLTNLINGTYNVEALGKADAGDKKGGAKKADGGARQKGPRPDKSMSVVKKEQAGSPPDLDELHSLVGSTQNDLDQLKDMLSGCNGFDANALLGLFSDESPDFGLPLNQTEPAPDGQETTDPLVSGNELAPYGINMIDFNELFDDSSDGRNADDATPTNDLNLLEGTINTPQLEPNELLFPAGSC